MWGTELWRGWLPRGSSFPVFLIQGAGLGAGLHKAEEGRSGLVIRPSLGGTWGPVSEEQPQRPPEGLYSIEMPWAPRCVFVPLANKAGMFSKGTECRTQVIWIGLGSSGSTPTFLIGALGFSGQCVGCVGWGPECPA